MIIHHFPQGEGRTPSGKSPALAPRDFRKHKKIAGPLAHRRVRSSSIFDLVVLVVPPYPPTTLDLRKVLPWPWFNDGYSSFGRLFPPLFRFPFFDQKSRPFLTVFLTDFDPKMVPKSSRNPENWSRKVFFFRPSFFHRFWIDFLDFR